MRNITVTHDTDAQALYVYLKRHTKVARTLELSNNIHLDLNTKGEPVGLEVIGVARLKVKQDGICRPQTSKRLKPKRRGSQTRSGKHPRQR